MRGARVGEGIGVVCVGIGGVQVLVWSDVRISDGLRAEASIEGLLEQIRSSNWKREKGNLTSMILTSVIGVLRRQWQRLAIGTTLVRWKGSGGAEAAYSDSGRFGRDFRNLLEEWSR